MDSENIQVLKASGEKEPFSEDKVRRSIRRTRIPKKLEDEVVRHVRDSLYGGIPTAEIYRHISEYLGNSSYPYTKTVYGLKQAIMQLGPSGYPFEKFVAAILSRHGYTVQTDVIVSGRCVDHEIDVVAQKENRRYMVECKFHNLPGVRSDVKVALYIQARFEDVQKGNEKEGIKPFDQAWLVTNTKCTTEAIHYGNCMGMQVLGWSHPQTGNLQDLIESAGLHPVTCLTSLTDAQKKKVLSRGIVLCRDLLEDKGGSLADLGLTPDEKSHVEKEVTAICKQGAARFA
ncbi:MAG: hypothetical protein A2900_02085 [Candidatus Chisholmbacteria bacterium RIFCSPLOWO2_01_FULL_50_28]|uniref:ATP-cone domain-containing protein n=1 Tax=Candidatus Chisholmbacteria bacterium RIFCSPHIGHO2_01_FULL_52_32 TaxID=1797591 RepID=A0A1G1VU77_9BACT|nr:MAG: hypothetical protein A2786_04660 [Candidatus Chisholmbacteria bacterium RIFCSPHIGHO2_01_FULL_52_32]OGY19873.1 MAG: hypothetical protein A2900_02085 [Candidatus Chisholmbacteria bacterium RIFCSPLOWO2_01_FULL_50_28]